MQKQKSSGSKRLGLIFGLAVLGLVFFIGAVFGPVEKNTTLSVKVYAAGQSEPVRKLDLVCNDKPSNKELCEQLKSYKPEDFASSKGEDCKVIEDKQTATIIGTVKDVRINTKFKADDSCVAKRWDRFEWLLGRR